MSSAPLFRGGLVRLCAPRPDDAELLSRWSEDAEFRRLADTDPPRPLSVERFQELDSDAGTDPNHFEFRVRSLDDDRLLGYVAITRIEWANRHGWMAVGIGDPAERGKGYGGEAVALLVRYAFDELGLHRLSLDVISDNSPALALYQRAGFQVEGRQRERVLRDGVASDLILMGLLRREWRALAKEDSTPEQG